MENSINISVAKGFFALIFDFEFNSSTVCSTVRLAKNENYYEISTPNLKCVSVLSYVSRCNYCSQAASHTQFTSCRLGFSRDCIHISSTSTQYSIPTMDHHIISNHIIEHEA